MITLIVLLALLIVFMTIGLCFHIAGGVLKLAFKLIFCLPCAVICGRSIRVDVHACITGQVY